MTVRPGEAGVDGDFGIQVEFAAPSIEALGDGFNKHGVRENEDGSIDVRFNAMEPGIRKGYKITEDFLRETVRKDYSRIPVQMSHSDSQRANVGFVEPENVVFNDNFVRLQLHIPNTGSSIRDDVIADFTHEPPAIKDISLGFDPKSVEVEATPGSEPPKFTDGRIREVSLTPFPAGYDNGGLTPAFSEAVETALDEAEFDDSDPEDCGCDAESKLVTKRYQIN